MIRIFGHSETRWDSDTRGLDIFTADLSQRPFLDTLGELNLKPEEALKIFCFCLEVESRVKYEPVLWRADWAVTPITILTL